MKYVYTVEELNTKYMLEKPITELSKTIGGGWFLSLESLSDKSGVKLQTIQRAIHGEPIATWFEKKIRNALE